MIVWTIRLLILILILAGIHFLLAWYFRWDKRRELEAAHGADPAPSESKDSFVSQGLADYDRSLRKKLLWLVWLLPGGIILALILTASYV